MASRKQSLYEILGVPRDASTADIDAAYERRKAGLDGSGSTDSNAMALLRDAHDALRNPARRATYDASLAAAEAREAADEKAAKDAPPVVIEDAEAPQRKLPWLPIGIALVILLVVVVMMSRGGKPETAEKHTDAMPGTAPATPAPPPPPAKRSGVEIIAEASTSGGQVLSYSMSGQAIPVGLAISTEPGTMITTCHGLPAGAKLVVRVQETSYPADLLTTDEVLDLCRLQVAGFATRPVKVSTTPAKASRTSSPSASTTTSARRSAPHPSATGSSAS